tara:strand:- start:784 stop:1200 length:417 start_codon:yes stop_codon:yes gene_type:complete
MARPYLSGSSASIKDIVSATSLSFADSGKSIMLNHATGIAVTLPDPTKCKGFEVKVIVKIAPTSGNHTVATTVGAIKGSISAGAADDVADTSSGSNARINFVASNAVVGDYVKLLSDGANYYIVGGLGKVAAGITIDG